MKTKLELAREEINKIDKEMIDLFVRRMNVVRDVAKYKIENNMEVLDESREISLRIKNVNELNDKEIEKYYLEFLDGVLRSSKDFQNDLINNYKGKK